MLLAAVTLVAACSPMSRRATEDPAAAEAYVQRAAALSGETRWLLDGRLAISDGEDGGGGSLVWFQDREQTRMRFRGTLGRGSWQLQADARGAELEMADGRRYAAATLADLVEAHVGWRVPVDALSWWVRGLASGHRWDSRDLDDAGHLIRLSQSGWQVEFHSYRDSGLAAMPSRLVARRDAYVVKLAVRDWRFGADAQWP